MKLCGHCLLGFTSKRIFYLFFIFSQFKLEYLIHTCNTSIAHQWMLWLTTGSMLILKKSVNNSSRIYAKNKIIFTCSLTYRFKYCLLNVFVWLGFCFFSFFFFFFVLFWLLLLPLLFKLSIKTIVIVAHWVVDLFT